MSALDRTSAIAALAEAERVLSDWNRFNDGTLYDPTCEPHRRRLRSLISDARGFVEYEHEALERLFGDLR